MTYYYIALETRSHAFLLEQRLRMENIQCELTYMPRDIMTDLCNMGIKFPEIEFGRAVNAIRRSGLPGYKIYKEIVFPEGYQYEII